MMDLIKVCKQLQRGCREDRARLFLVVPCARARGSGHKLEDRRFSLNTVECFFTAGVGSDRALHGMPEGLCSLHCQRSSEATWTWAWAACSVWSCLSRGLGQTNCREPFLPQPHCDHQETICAVLFCDLTATSKLGAITVPCDSISCELP